MRLRSCLDCALALSGILNCIGLVPAKCCYADVANAWHTHQKNWPLSSKTKPMRLDVESHVHACFFIHVLWCQSLVDVLLYRPGRRSVPATRSWQGNNTSRMSTLWHLVSLSFAADPMRSHREWAGVIDRLPETAHTQAAAPRVGAIIRCLHRDLTSPNGHGR